MRPLPIVGAIIHEIIHMAIQHLIDAHGVSHWRKEALVDFLLERFFPTLHMRQRIPEDVSVVGEALQASWPDLEQVARAIGGV